MDYIIFDLEFNQFYQDDNEENKPEPNCPLEIIQIGAIKLDENLIEKARFTALIKPQIYKKVHPYIEKLTKITDADLQRGKSFEKVYEEFTSFIGDQDNILVVWGMVDLQVLYRNITYFELDTNLLPKGYINIQNYATKSLEVPNSGKVGLENAVTLLGIEKNISFHDALNDAIYTGQILKKIYSKDIIPDIYNYEKIIKVEQERKIKKVLDEEALIKQFEKMYDKALCREEIDMLLLAYRMGATQQFLVPQEKG